MSAEYSEDKLVQQTTSDFFENELQWRSVYAYNCETYGINSTLGRKDQTETILTRYLRQAIEQLNPNHPSTAYDDAIKRLIETTSSQTPIQINQDKYKLIRDGIRVSYKNDKGELKEPLLKVIDFDNPANNDFLIVRELWIQGKNYHKRPDIIGFVNGIPLLFIELKRTNREVKVAYDTNYTDYRDTIPAIFHHNAMVMLSNGIDAKVGTITSPYNFFHEWRRLAETEKGRVHFETMLRGMCSKQNFLDLFQNFILFDDSSGTTYKILARNHQYLGVNNAFIAVQNRETNLGKLGVFWHTQGSGKSYSMAFLTEKVHRKLAGNFTFLIVTDRVELDNQIVQTFIGVGATRDDSTQATNGDQLKELLKQNNRYVFTLIHKFNQTGHKYSDRHNIIVISDEAHRTQYGKLAENMRLGLPQAAFIGFTGTPLFESAEDQKTKEIFGDYVSTYDFQQAIEEGSTVPLYYDNRGEKLVYTNQNGEQKSVALPEEISDRIATEISKHELTEEEEAQVMRRIGGDYLILTADKRLDRIAQDLVAHYTKRWQTGKAMLVCLDKITAVRMHHLIDLYWKQKIEHQQKRVKQATDDQDLIEKQMYLDWLTKTEYLVVISEAQNEVKNFKEWGYDIEPHRAIIKSRNLEEEFKKPEHPFRLAIVCAMWLTGFDVPSLSTLYMDKPMKGHNLMQAIARANRVDEGKNNGLLIDYNGILKSLRAALAKYAKTKSSGTSETENDDGTQPYQDLEKLRDDYAASVQACINHLADLGFDLQTLIEAKGFDQIALLDRENTDSAVNAVCTSDESRARFEVLAREIFKKKLALIADLYLTEPFQSRHNAIEAIHNQLHQKQELATNLNAVLRSLHGVVSEVISVTEELELGEDSGKLYDISKINFDLLKSEFTKTNTKNTQIQTLKEAIEQQLKRMLHVNPLRKDFYTQYKQIMDEYNKETDRATIEQTFEKLLEIIANLSEEDSRATREGLTEESQAIFDLLCLNKNDLAPKTRNQIKAIAQGLIDAIKGELNKLDNWAEKESTQAQVETFINDYLYSDVTGLPDDAYNIEEELEPISKVIFLHVYTQYSRKAQNPYAEAA